MSVLLQLLPALIFLFVVVSVIRNVAKVVGKLNEQGPPRRVADFDPEQAARTRRIQEEIRRKIAERRGLVIPAEVAPAPEAPAAFAPPVMVGDHPLVEVAPDATTAAIMERQERLAEQMRELEAARSLAQRKAADAAAAARSEQESERGVVAGLNRGVLADLQDPANLRRAFVLREVLGPPVGLR